MYPIRRTRLKASCFFMFHEDWNLHLEPEVANGGNQGRVRGGVLGSSLLRRVSVICLMRPLQRHGHGAGVVPSETRIAAGTWVCRYRALMEEAPIWAAIKHRRGRRPVAMGPFG